MHGLLVVLTRLKTNKEKRTSGIKKAVVGRISGVVALTGCFYKKMYGRFAGSKKSDRNNEVVVWRGSTVAPKISPKYLTCDHTVEFKEKKKIILLRKVNFAFMIPNPSLDCSYVVLNFWPNLSLVILIKLFL